ncbi:MAG: hypothetical protein KAR57_03105 [Bacteroidales bacterium]|nr:hypothetical protein [Bacteroidales bacterium]
MQNLKITIIGNSVSLRTRPVEKHPDNKNYGKLLEEFLCQNASDKNIVINNKATGAYTVYNVLTKIDDFVNTFPDYYIINLGVVDASTREIPLWFYRLASSKKKGFVYKLLSFFYRGLIIKARPAFVKLRGKRSWISSKKYRKYFSHLVKTLIKETNAKIIVMPINPANNRVEKELPGSLKNHLLYTKLMKDISLEFSQHFLELNNLNSEEHYPDGVHYSISGHNVVAQELGKIILKENN